MKRNTIALTIAITALLVYFAFAQDSSAPKRTTWEYKVVTVYELTDVESVDELLETGADDARDKPAARVETGGEDKQDEDAKPDAISGLEELGKSMQSRANKRIENGLNKLGADGWELCARTEHSFYFKRQRR